MRTNPKNLADVREALSGLYAEVMNDPKTCVQVHEASNALGKVIGACKIHLEACKLSQDKLKGEWKAYVLADKTIKKP